MPFWLQAAAMAAAGTIAGTLNVMAGGGSFLTLPLLIFFGLPASLANGTNRVGVLLQSISGTWGFHRQGIMDWRWSLAASVPAVAGAAAGVWLALVIPDFAFRRALSIAMVAVTIWSLVAQPRVAAGQIKPASHWTVVTGFFFVGLYGGFIQAGVGFLVLAITSAAGMDLVRGNAVKLLTVLLVTVLSLLAFAGAGQVDWPLGLALGVGNFTGGLIGARLTVAWGHAWLQRLVTAAVVAFAVLLWVS